MATNNTGQHSADMTIYDAAETTLVFNDLTLYGFQGGSAIFTLTWDNDRASINQDTYGTSVVSKNHKDTATLTVNLSITSPCNKNLEEWCKSGDPFPVFIHTPTNQISCAEAVITKFADISAEDNAPVRAWTVHLLNAVPEAA